MDQKDIFVIGHKNPDTDSICSAIAYAYLKRQITGDNYIPKRAGQVSTETAYVLKKFGMKTPGYINDVHSQVKDVVLDKGYPVKRGMSVKNAWSALKENDLDTLAVIRKDNKLEGLITVGDIAYSYMGAYKSTIIADARTPYKNILDTIKGTMVVGDENACVTKGKVLVAAANPDLMEEYIEDGDIVIMGDRYESQLCALEMNAGCLIICLGSKISDGIIHLAKEKGSTLIQTDYDTFIAARLLNQSVPIEYFMVKDRLVTFKMEDFIEDIRATMAKLRYRDFPVVSPKGEFIGMITRHSLIGMQKKQIVLVDHNEKAQAVDGMDDADILEIIDHHKLGMVETLKPVLFMNRPVGCTSTIVYRMFVESQTEIPKDIAGIMCAAILSDTLMYRSPTCTPLDKLAAEALAQIAGIETESFAAEMFSAGSNLKAKSAEEIFYQDYKKFSAGSTVFGVGQITSMSQEELDGAYGRVLDYMKKVQDSHNVDTLYFMLTNILTESTELLCSNSEGMQAVKEAFKVTKSKESSINLRNVVSRKKQLIPKLMNALQQ